MSLHKKLTECNCSQTEKQKTVLFESETYSMTRVVRFMNKCFLVNQKQDQFVNQATHVLCGFYLPKRTNSIPTHFLGDLSIEMFKECFTGNGTADMTLSTTLPPPSPVSSASESWFCSRTFQPAMETILSVDQTFLYEVENKVGQ